MDIDILKLARLQKDERRAKIFELNEYLCYELFAEERQNIVDFIPIDKTDSVLELNSESGIITRKIADKSGKVVSVEENQRYYDAAELVNQDKDNVELVNGSVEAFINDCREKFDYIFIINRLYEIIENDLFEGIYNLLTESGKLIVATDNKLGLKYWAGCQEPLNGGFFVGLENYQLVSTTKKLYSKKELERLMTKKGIKKYRFLYPYPDYKFAVSIYSDKRLPKKGELDNNIRDFEGDRYLLFDEKKVFDTILDEGLFSLYSNSYLVVIDR